MEEVVVVVVDVVQHTFIGIGYQFIQSPPPPLLPPLLI